MTNFLRTCVVVDYQNMHLTAHGLYDCSRHGPKHDCLLDPATFAANLLSVRNSGQRPGHRDAELTTVLVYRGLPSNRHDPASYGRSLAQKAQWERDTRVKVHLRPLKYRFRYDSQGEVVRDSDGNEIIDGVEEKGIDVLCALAVVRSANSGDYDLVILASHDSDLEPALDEVLERGRVKIETCQWWGGIRPTKQLRSSVRNVWNTRLGESEFRRCWDLTNY